MEEAGFAGARVTVGGLQTADKGRYKLKRYLGAPSWRGGMTMGATGWE
jgi:hypothetical protein